MKQVILFDWGNTLMVDFTQYSGKMYLWPEVKAVEQAQATLQALSKEHDLYVATSARDSCESEVRAAFQRAELDQHIKGYFCKANLGIDKDCPEFYQAILKSLDLEASQVTMVGDTLEKDIYPAREAGLRTIYFNRHNHPLDENIVTIHNLSQLLENKW